MRSRPAARDRQAAQSGGVHVRDLGVEPAREPAAVDVAHQGARRGGERRIVDCDRAVCDRFGVFTQGADLRPRGRREGAHQRRQSGDPRRQRRADRIVGEVGDAHVVDQSAGGRQVLGAEAPARPDVAHSPHERARIGERVLDLRQERAHGHRLGDNRVGAGVARAADHVRGGAPGEHDGGRLYGGAVGGAAQPFDQHQPVLAAQTEVGEQSGGLGRLHCLLSGGDARRGDDVGEAGAGHDGGEERAHLRALVDDEQGLDELLSHDATGPVSTWTLERTHTALGGAQRSW